ncbi:xylose isomerase-like protein [Collybia nuda]|uniref:Apurinic-apyrimidinic endonuclease 1 n=1 Tax=Collybia nuda TaxID=64659 RepID=A0A9P5XVG2_9AGAR|nr:xylose isomerase-like protein [Collybia nuda]
MLAYAVCARSSHIPLVFRSSSLFNIGNCPVMVKTRRSSAISGEDGAEPSSKRIKLDDEAKTDRVTEVQKPLISAKPKRKTGATKKADKSVLPERTTSLWKVGAHVSAAGGVENAVVNAAEIGANAFAIFLKSQRKWTSPDLTSASIQSFKTRMEEYGYSNGAVLPHGSYLINLGNVDDGKRKKSYDCFLDDLKRCEQLGLELYNFHPGSTVGATTTKNSISLIAECINEAHKETKYVTTVLENMASSGAGNVIGCDFSHLADIISAVKDKSRVGVCLDTCHMFAAGYDIRTKEAWDTTLEKFDKQVGLSYLRGMHLNDSKTELNSKRDRHENIGIGHIGLRAFHHIFNDVRVQNIPLILETPSFELPKETWAKEIDVLNRLSGLDLSKGDALSDMEEDIRCAVKDAEKSSGKGKTKVKGTSRKTKKKGRDEDETRDHEDHAH